MPNLLRMTRSLFRSSATASSAAPAATTATAVPQPLIAIATLCDPNLFQCLPAEIFQEILTFLPLRDIGQLALASKSLRNLVARWIGCRVALRRVSVDLDLKILNQPTTGMNFKDAVIAGLRSTRQQSNEFAILCKRLTCLYGTHDRITFAFQSFNQLLELVLAPRRPQFSRDWAETIFSVHFLRMLHVFTRGWDESEFPRLLTAVDRQFGLGEKLQTFLACERKEDACVSNEMRLRLILRILTWDFAGTDYGHRAVRAQSRNLS